MNSKNCQWSGNLYSCCTEPVFKKSYCKSHYFRVYVELTPEMADYILNKEIVDNDFMPFVVDRYQVKN